MDHTEVKAALARVMSRIACFPALIQESNDKITKDTIVEKIETKAESLGVSPSTVAKDLLLSHLRSVMQKASEGHNCLSEHEELADIMEYLVERKILAGTELEEHLLHEPSFFSLPLPAIWRMSHARIISLEQVIKRIYKKHHGRSSFLVNGLLDLLLHPSGQSSSQAAGDVLALLVGLMYSASGSNSQEWQPLAKFAGEVLKSVTEGVLDVVLDSSEQKGKVSLEKQSEDPHQRQMTPKNDEKDSSGANSTQPAKDINMYQLVVENPKVPQEALEGYFSAQLAQILTHRPNIKLTKALKTQEAWCSAKANPTLVAFLQKLVVGLGHEEAFNILELVLSNEEVNWGCVLTLVATALTCHRATSTKLKELIERNIRRGCEELEREPMVVGFLFARHAGQEGPHVFPSYAHWFSSLFTSESTSPTAQKQGFIFLMRFLTDMVPYEPAHCLRAHLTTHIFTPKGCHEIFQSYTYLAKARLQELKEASLDSTQRFSSKTKAVEDVEAAAKYFSETGKVPSFVLEASIFRETYFRTSFLPALLAPRHLPEVPDARAKLIEVLHARGKITSTMLKNYTEACEKEASDLLQGVFMDVEEDIVIEEPIAELAQILENLVTAHFNCCASDSNVAISEILPLLSKVSCKIEEMMKSSDARFKGASHIILDTRLYDEKLLAFQIVEHIFITLERLLHPPDTEEGHSKRELRPEWLSQLLSLLSSSVTLQRSLSVLLHRHLSLLDITKEQLRIDGIILYELSKIEGLFLPVVEATQPTQDPSPPTGHYLNCIPLDIPENLHHACCILSSWLEWHLMCEGKAASLPAQPLHLYLCLAPRLPLLLNHNGGREATVADFYNYLRGSGVPECSSLCFSDDLKGQDCKVPIKLWVQFELRAAWGNVPVEVRQTYLYSYLMENVSLDQQLDKQSSEKPTTCLIVPLIFVLIEKGLLQRNSSDLLMLVQTAGQHSGGQDVCLLEAWHKSLKTGFMDTRRTLSFMSICRCVSPSLFLRAEKLLELSEILQMYVNTLQSATDVIQLSLCDVTFLCVSLFTAAAVPVVRSLHVELCLNPIKPSVVFHWDSLRNFFTRYRDTVMKHECLKNLCSTFDMELPQQISLLGAKEGGIRLLSLSLNQDTCNVTTDIASCSNGKTSYLKWLLAYLGLQQVSNDVPYLLREGEKLSVHQLNKNIILWSYKELIKALQTKGITEIIRDILPVEEETHLGLRLVPVACIFVVMCVKEGNFENDAVMIVYEANLLDIILQCHNLICQAFDTQSNGDNKISDSHCSKRSLSSKRWVPDLDYLSHVHHKILSYLSASSSSILDKIPKNTLLKCDPEIKATIYSRLASKKKKRC